MLLNAGRYNKLLLTRLKQAWIYFSGGRSMFVNAYMVHVCKCLHGDLFRSRSMWETCEVTCEGVRF